LKGINNIVKMISTEEAYRIVTGNARETGTEIISFRDALGRILAEDVISDTDMPPFNRSAVDGFACRKDDLGNELEITETIRAGKEPEKTVGKLQCARIMTGAIVPDSCDFVFMIENSTILPSGKVVFTGIPRKLNYTLKGEDVRCGDVILRKGKLIRPQEIAALTSVGHISVKVARKPAIAVISTGDELVEPENKPERARIRNSNAYQLLAQAEAAGAKAKYYGIAPDDESSTYDLISRAISENELVIITGGVSMGDFDFVPSVLRRAGVTILFDRVNVQPGRPTTFGTHEKGVVFGLPGNPVSAFIQFETLVKPLIYKMMGSEWTPLVQNLPMAVKFERKSHSRAAWIPVAITDKNEAMPAEYHGSAHITAYPNADGIVLMPPDKVIFEKGEIVSVRQI